MAQTRMDSTYVSQINFMKQREIMNKVVDLYDEEETIVDIMTMTDRYVPTAVKEYIYHSNTRVHAAATVAGITAEPAVGASSNITLTGGSLKPRVGDIMLTAGRNRAYVSVVSGNVITVKPVNENAIAHEAFAASDQVTFFTNGYAEGTGAQMGYKWPTIQYQNNVQIIKGKYGVTDIGAYEKVEVEFEGKPYYYIKGVKDAFKRFKMDIAYAMLIGERAVGLTDANGDPVMLTQGLEPTIRGNGIELQLRTDTTANFKTDFRAFNRAFDQARGPQEYWMWNGPDISNYVDDWLTELEGIKAGGIIYNSFGGINGKERSVQLGFDSFRIYDRTFHKKKLSALDNPEITAANGFSYPSTSFFIPTGKVKTQYDTESKERFRLRYFEPPKAMGLNVNRTDQYREVLTGSLAPTPTNDVDELNVTYTTVQGTEFLGQEHFGINTFTGG